MTQYALRTVSVRSAHTISIHKPQKNRTQQEEQKETRITGLLIHTKNDTNLPLGIDPKTTNKLKEDGNRPAT